jgi:hypothetical protein
LKPVEQDVLKDNGQTQLDYDVDSHVHDCGPDCRETHWKAKRSMENLAVEPEAKCPTWPELDVWMLPGTGGHLGHYHQDGPWRKCRSRQRLKWEKAPRVRSRAVTA